MPRIRKIKEVAPEPDLTVSAVVTVFVSVEDGSARVALKVDCDGHEGLVELIKHQEGKIHIVGRTLRRVVMAALSFDQDSPVIDLRKAGRA